MTQVRMGFEAETIRVPIQSILPTRLVSQEVLQSVKYQAILASIRELGIVEPLAVHPEKRINGDAQHFILLDGHLRLEALKELGDQEVVCLVSTDDEGFTYNRQINRVSAIQEHKMILAAIKKGVPAERIAQVLNVNVDRTHERQHLLDGIAPEVVELLKDRMIGRQVFRVLRKMKPMRQIEAAEMMLSANRFTQSYVDMILVATRSEQLIDKKKTKHTEVTPEDIAHMELEMEKLHHDYQLVEETLGETMLVLVVAKGYISRLIRNEAI
ncbi:plasmid partitioning protein RepB C-terminal domain-containing protein [Chromobacterium sp.]|uniref:ParB/RepB/Spo0J family partition protein n=1 Tax=Chromobacterium sp. TaxID=306190 RepID=UPI0035B1372E